ncbi:long-chain-fatty-acid--CoA ligase [Bradyrhizobium sp. G127]|uniref:long-chain-fatty-acid--CoA ligase n=1 Tax=Bradyrhizobium sp. G127 TaxID=2904800 RepID=UPI001F26B8AE|nr:long-chain-fatty-acid--CoA ligase [Bradyrhizobium sp. G127]MCF2523876.1 long-chain-fatty-acid--CoA ligase [Bradyrhizobium sp. G127]
MQNQPLLLSSLLRHADRFHASTEIVSRTVEGPIHRYTYRDAARRARQLASALQRHGIEHSDRVATLAWNNYRHFEIEHGVTGMGAIWHAINPRLIPAQLIYIANHAEDKVLFFESSFLPVVEKLAPDLSTVGLFVLMADRAALPAVTNIPNLQCYEDFIASGDEGFVWPVFDELSASSLFYTSGTTGNPKGVLYSHRSDVLHCLSITGVYSMGLAATDTILPMTPMFHANGAWGFTHAAPMVGAKLVFPGPKMDAASIAELIETEAVTVTAGVPTLYSKLLQHFEDQGRGAGTMQRLVVAGSAPAPSMIEGFERLGVSVNHVWGMTETSPCGTSTQPSRKAAKASPQEQLRRKTMQGTPVYGVDVKIADENGNELPHDGKSSGRFMVRGPWVLSGYYRDEKPLLEDGWFNTGDLAVMDDDNYIQLTDRAKDVIKSGGEWISSIDVENLAAGCPGVAEAAVIGIPHPQWEERPLLIVVPAASEPATAKAVLSFLEGKIAKWWMPDDVIFVEALTYGATGKVQKMELRRRFAGHYTSQKSA